MLERGIHPKQVITRLRSLEKNYPIFSVMGNHDEGFLSGKKVSASSFESMDAHEKLNDEDLSFFKQNYDGTFGNQEYVDTKNGLFCVHGGPLDPKKITPKNADSEAWLYQRNWQRLTDEGFEFFRQQWMNLCESNFRIFCPVGLPSLENWFQSSHVHP